MTGPRSGYDDTRNDCKCSVEESCDLCRHDCGGGCPDCVGDALADMVDNYDPDAA